MKPVNQYDKDWLFVKRYPSIKDAAAETGILAAGISNACRGVSSHAGGYHWVLAYIPKIHPMLVNRRKTDLKTRKPIKKVNVGKL